MSEAAAVQLKVLTSLTGVAADDWDACGNTTEWMFGKTPPAAIVTVPRSLESSSSLRIASWMWRGTTRDFLLSRAALPASSSTSAHKYSYAA